MRDEYGNITEKKHRKECFYTLEFADLLPLFYDLFHSNSGPNCSKIHEFFVSRLKGSRYVRSAPILKSIISKIFYCIVSSKQSGKSELHPSSSSWTTPLASMS